MNPVLSRKITVLVWFAIVAVVWIHAYDKNLDGGFRVFGNVQDWMSNGLTRFAVPLFFAVPIATVVLLSLLGALVKKKTALMHGLLTGGR